MSCELLICVPPGLTFETFIFRPLLALNVFWLDISKTSDCFPILQYLAGFYKGDRDCLLHGRNWLFKYLSS
jgi:hypothetical protein